MDLGRWEFGHAGNSIRSLARIQLRDQLVECNAPPAVLEKKEPTCSAEIFACFIQSEKRCEVDLDLDRLRDTLLDILTLPSGMITASLEQDAEFFKDNMKKLEHGRPAQN
jgi:hypothetical protein